MLFLMAVGHLIAQLVILWRRPETNREWLTSAAVVVLACATAGMVANAVL